MFATPLKEMRNSKKESNTSTNAGKSLPEEHSYFYDEIFPDFQTRQKAALKEMESVPTDVPNRIGMETITPKTNTEKYFVEFASTSTVHGLKHLVAPHRHPAEKFLATLFIAGALLCLIYLSLQFWDRYQNDATVIIVNNERDRFRISKPAIFICPVPNVMPSKIPDAFKKHGVEQTPEAERFFTFLANVNYQNMSETPNFDQVPPRKWLAILHDLRKDSPANRIEENDPYKTWIVTERGVCLARRNVFAVYATYEYWASNNWTVVPVPNEVPYYDRNYDRGHESFAAEGTVLFAMCDPFEMLSFDVPTKWVQPQVIENPIMSISEIKTQTTVRELQIHQRQCKFRSDGGLRTWPIYTKNMCTIECRMRVIEDRCKCRPHFARPTEGVDICNAAQLRCIGGIKKDLFLFEDPPSSCGCVPNCDVVTYQITEGEISELYDTPTISSVISLIIELPQVIYHRALLYGFTDFLTGVGGAAGLFLGASVLSFVEIFYYATLRVCFYLKRAKREYKKDKTVNLSQTP